MKPDASSPQSPSPELTRRESLKLGAGAALALGMLGHASWAEGAVEDAFKVRNGRIRQSVVPWCFNPMPEEDLIGHAARLGLKSVELISPKHWPRLKELGMTCAISGSHGFAKGFAHVEEHEECLASLRQSIDRTAEAGFPSVITFSGFRRGLTTEDGVRNMVSGLKKIAGYAEQKKVTLCLEMLNSRVSENMKGHPDYFCDDMDLTIDILRQVGSERCKVLFDIYHVQIMNGDLIVRLRQYKEFIGHYHTAGVPGRAELDDHQEIHYPAVMKAIVETGYQGYVGQEFIPTRDKVTSLGEAVRLCDV